MSEQKKPVKKLKAIRTPSSFSDDKRKEPVTDIKNVNDNEQKSIDLKLNDFIISSFDAEEQEEVKPTKSENRISSSIYDWLEIFTVSIAVVFILFSFVARIAVVDGNSMLPTLENGNKLIVRQLLYTPKQGDIIVCQSETYGLDKPLVKRIIATEGQTVRIDRLTWTVYVDDKPLKEEYVLKYPGEMFDLWSYSEDEITVSEGHVFVMGDNRNYSRDSRDFKIGQIDERYIVGKVIFRFTPLDKLGTVK